MKKIFIITFFLCISANFEAFSQTTSNPINYIATLQYPAASGSANNASSISTIITDNQSLILAGGRYTQVVDFDPGFGNFNLPLSGNTDAFIWGISTGTGFLGALHLGAPTGEVYLESMKLIGPNIYFVGSFIGNTPPYWTNFNLDFNPFSTTYGLSQSPDIHTSNQYVDLFITKFTSLGYQWTITLGGTDADTANDITEDSLGNIYVTGGISNTVDLDPSANIASFTVGNNNQYHPFIAKYDSSGNYIWAQAFFGFGDGLGYKIFSTAQNDILVVGNQYLFNPINNSPNILNYSTPVTPQGYGFITKLNSSGVYQWFVSLPGDLISKAVMDTTGNVYVVGTFHGTVDFNPNPNLSTLKTSNGGQDIFVVKYDTSGNFLWVKTFGTPEVSPNDQDAVTDIVLNNYGEIEIIGKFYGTADFNPDPNVNNSSTSFTFLASPNPPTYFTYASGYHLILDSNGNYVFHRVFGPITKLTTIQKFSNYSLIAGVGYQFGFPGVSTPYMNSQQTFLDVTYH